MEQRRYGRCGRTVRHLNREAVRYVAGCCQSLGVTVAVVQRVVDYPGGNRERRRAVGASFRVGYTCFGCRPTGGNHRGSVVGRSAVNIAFRQTDAARCRAGCAVGYATGFNKGCCGSCCCHRRRIIRPRHRNPDFRHISSASCIRHLIGKHFGNRGTCRKGIYSGVIIINNIFIRSISTNSQRTVQSGYCSTATAACRSCRHRRQCLASAQNSSSNPINSFRFTVAINISVIDQNIPRSIRTTRTIADPAGLGRRSGVCYSNRSIITPGDRYCQLGGICGSCCIAYGVGKNVRQCVTGSSQCLDSHIVVVQLINITAIGIKRQCAVCAGKCSAKRTGGATAGLRPGTEGGNCFAVSTIDVGVVNQHISRPNQRTARSAVIKAAGFIYG